MKAASHRLCPVRALSHYVGAHSSHQTGPAAVCALQNVPRESLWLNIGCLPGCGKPSLKHMLQQRRTSHMITSQEPHPPPQLFFNGMAVKDICSSFPVSSYLFSLIVSRNSQCLMCLIYSNTLLACGLLSTHFHPCVELHVCTVAHVTSLPAYLYEPLDCLTV